VSSFHYDVVYLKSYDEYLPVGLKIIDEAIDILDNDAEHKFLVEQVILLEKYWELFPDRRDSLVRHAQSGRLAIAPGMFVMPDMNLPSGESLFMQIKAGKDWLRENLGVDPEVCWIADCWGHHSQIPQILSMTGYKYYVFWRSARRDVLKNDFIWEGLDGSSVRTHWLARGYSGVVFPGKVEAANVKDLALDGSSEQAFCKLLGSIEPFGPSEAVLLCNGGDLMHPQATGTDLIRNLNSTGNLPPICMSTPQEFLDSVDWDSKPVVLGEFNSMLQGSFTSNIRVKQLNRRLTSALTSLETLSVLLNNPYDYTYIWRIALKGQFHDTICGTICDKGLMDSLDESENGLAKVSEAMPKLDIPNGITAIANTLSFPRTAFIQHDGNWLQTKLPAFGFAELADAAEIRPLPDGSLPYSFENAFYRVKIGMDGYISSLVSRNGDIELVNADPCSFGSLGMQIDNGDLWMNFDSPVAGGSLESSLEQNHPDPYNRYDGKGLVNTGTFNADISGAEIAFRSEEMLVVEQMGSLIFWRLNVQFITRITFYKSLPRIEFETTIHPSGKHYRIRAAFPTLIIGGVIRHEIPFGIQERCSGEHVAQNWMDYGDDRVGVALLNDGIPSNNVDQGIMLLTLFRAAAMEYKTESALSFAEGVPHTFRYAVMPHRAGCFSEVIRAGHDFVNRPSFCRVASAMIGPSEWALDKENVFISALRGSDGKIFLRIYEGTGTSTAVSIAIPKTVTAYAEADGIERAVSAFRPCSGRIECEMGAFEIKGFLFLLKDDANSLSATAQLSNKEK